ncbi:hypothetical protein NPIL_388782 [Nephila pilipes]|nr:hypothetical protein NPIL_388782 [Nephila pilipes]
MRRNTVGLQINHKAARERRVTGHAQGACARLLKNPPAPPNRRDDSEATVRCGPGRKRSSFGVHIKVSALTAHKIRIGCGVLWKGTSAPGPNHLLGERTTPPREGRYFTRFGGSGRHRG